MAGVKYDTPPFGCQNKDNEIVGFDVDIVRKIAEDIGVPVEFVAVTSPTRIPMLASGNVALVAASMPHTKKRDEAIDFSITYYTGGQSLLVTKGRRSEENTSELQSIKSSAYAVSCFKKKKKINTKRIKT